MRCQAENGSMAVQHGCFGVLKRRYARLYITLCFTVRRGVHKVNKRKRQSKEALCPD